MEIWKFELPLTGAVQMPKGTRVLSVANQREKLCLWALVEPNAEREDRTFTILGTGHRHEGDPGKHIGTAQFDSGMLVLHVFDPAAE